MTIMLLDGKYRLKPYQTCGRLCWELYVGKRAKPDCYPSTIGRALRWITEYEVRNGGDQSDVLTLAEALERYERICQTLAGAAENFLSGTSAGD